LFIAATTVITLIILIRRMRWREYACTSLSRSSWDCCRDLRRRGTRRERLASIASAFYSFFTLLGMFIFADKKYKNELIKRFHF
jgi:lysylphosphatidylglycerol synthetase-like protein (DUF2156 family)